MKYILVIVVIAAGAWYYKGNMNVQENELTISQRIANDGFVEAGVILDKSKELVNFVCKDEKVLRSWGSSSEACFSRMKNFGEMCEERIFPNKKAEIRSDKEAKALMSRYNKCVIPS